MWGLPAHTHTCPCPSQRVSLVYFLDGPRNVHTDKQSDLRRPVLGKRERRSQPGSGLGISFSGNFKKQDMNSGWACSLGTPDSSQCREGCSQNTTIKRPRIEPLSLSAVPEEDVLRVEGKGMLPSFKRTK